MHADLLDRFDFGWVDVLQIALVDVLGQEKSVSPVPSLNELIDVVVPEEQTSSFVNLLPDDLVGSQNIHFSAFGIDKDRVGAGVQAFALTVLCVVLLQNVRVNLLLEKRVVFTFCSESSGFSPLFAFLIVMPFAFSCAK